MKAIGLALLLVAWSSAFAQQSPQPAPDPAKYGEYPSDYMTVVKEWLETQLLDPASAVVEFTSQPKPADLPARGGQPLYGYLVEFKVNSRNRFGAYTGFQKHGALIHNGTVVRGTGFGF
ncbi:MAG: hypothetical protein ACJ8KU_01670 [Chthoniobacterales bacterium]